MMLARLLTVLLLVGVAIPAPGLAAPRNGQHDLDFEIGTWNIAVKRLVHPLSGSHQWASSPGFMHLVRKVWGGRASLAELENTIPSPHYLGLMLRLYDAKAGTWSIYWVDGSDNSFSPPLVGAFHDGVGTFYNHDSYDGKPIEARVIYSHITRTSFHTEQAFSVDGGKTWETNLVQDFTRVSP